MHSFRAKAAFLGRNQPPTRWEWCFLSQSMQYVWVRSGPLAWSQPWPFHSQASYPHLLLRAQEALSRFQTAFFTPAWWKVVWERDYKKPTLPEITPLQVEGVCKPVYACSQGKSDPPGSNHMTFTAKPGCLPPCACHMYSDDDPTHLPLSHAPFLIMQHQCANMRRVFFLCSCSVQCDVTRSAPAIGIKVLKPCLIGFHKFIVNQMLVRLHCKKPLKFSSKLTTFKRENNYWEHNTCNSTSHNL